MRARLPGAAAFLLALAPISISGQTIVEIDDEIACAACRIETGPPTTLAAPDDRVWFSGMSAPRVSRDSEGYYIAAPVEGEALIAVFDPNGEYRSSYGGIGGGPGEFSTSIPLLVVVGEGDVLFAIDPVNLHTLAPQAESSLNQVRMPVQVLGNLAVLRSGIAVESIVETEAGVTSIQLLRPDGTIAASIGGSGTGGDPLEAMQRRALGRSNDHVDVWIAISRAPRSFTALSPSVGAFSGGRTEELIGPSMDLNRFLHTTVEVLDPVAGEVIARRDFEHHARFVRTADNEVLLFRLRADDTGSLECVVTPLSLQRG